MSMELKYIDAVDLSTHNFEGVIHLSFVYENHYPTWTAIYSVDDVEVCRIRRANVDLRTVMTALTIEMQTRHNIFCHTLATKSFYRNFIVPAAYQLSSLEHYMSDIGVDFIEIFRDYVEV